ncbi:MAG: molybdenum cofactor biosynthesis protein MoaE [Gammaproteobacteria bacterium]
MLVELRGKEFDPWQEIQEFQDSHPELAGKFGATSIFVGTMRDFNEDNDVSAMTLEHYPAMTQKHLEDISTEAIERWELLDTLIIHRYGEIKPDDAIVLLAVWSAHRAESFSACRYLIEELKTRAPFWKKESVNEKTRWVQKNTPAE